MIAVVLAAVPWHWWVAPMLVIAEAIALVVLAVAYYRKVLVPEHQLRKARLRELQRPRRPGAVVSAGAEHPERQVTDRALRR